MVELHEKWVQISDEKKEQDKRIKTLEKEVKELTQQLSSSKEAYANEKIKFE